MEEIVLAAVMFIGVASIIVVGVYSATPAHRLEVLLRSVREDYETLFFRLQKERASAKSRLRSAADQYAVEWRSRLLRDLPAESLRAIGAENVRWSALETAGVKSLADLPRRKGALTRIQGVGEVSAERLIESADRAEEALATLPIPPPRVDSDSETESELLHAAASQLGIRDVQAEFSAELLEVEAELNRLTAETPGILGWMRQPSRTSERARELTPAVQEAESRVRELSESLRASLANWRRSSSPLTRVDEVRELIEETLPGEVSPSKYGQGLREQEARSVDELELLIPHFSVPLRTYQEFGARFMVYYRRTLIGDEMGLGKTIQALAAISHLKESGASHFLVVAPAGVIYNWAHESADKARLPSVMLHGEDRRLAFDAWLESGGLAITSYSTLRSLDIQRIDRLDLLIADEAHYVKNPEAQRSRAVWELAARADYVSFMTGTPIENRVQEFVRLVQPLDHQIFRRLKGMLGLTFDDFKGEARKELAAEAVTALVTGQISPDPTTTVAMTLLREARGQLTEYVVPPTAFRRLVRHVYLRRTQRDVLTELPEAIVKNEWVNLNAAERRSYDQSVRSGAFMTMRRLASTGDGVEGAKFEQLDGLLEDYRARGHKVVVFSFFRDTLDALESLPDVQGRIDGSVSAKDRSEIIDGFWRAAGHAVLLGQIKAAGVGINLQCASAVVLMEPQIKPSLEDQAIARVVRMGQEHRVVVHRFIAEHTVEEHLERLLHQKRTEFELYAQQSLAKETHEDATGEGLEKKIVELEYGRLLSEAPVD